MRTLLLILVWAMAISHTWPQALRPVVLDYPCGSAKETEALLAAGSSSVQGNVRLVPAGSAVEYRFNLPLPATIEVGLLSDEGSPQVQIRAGNRTVTLQALPPLGQAKRWTATVQGSSGQPTVLRVIAKNSAVRLRQVIVTARPIDADRDGVPDTLSKLLALPKAPPTVTEPVTSFQTHAPYSSQMAVPNDVAIVYSPKAERMLPWQMAGYAVHTMYSFRTYTEYAQAHPEQVQRDRNNNPLVIERVSFYMVPAPARVEAAKEYARQALRNGSLAIVPEEPEYFAHAGYEQTFQQAWQQVYRETWQPPHSSPQARWRSERLKGQMKLNILREMLQEAQRINPKASRMVALHSPINYANWGIVTSPYAQLIKMPEVQEIIGQVWTGTARSACLLDGVRAERTFETAYLEYSSLWNLVRGTNKKLWFLMDPVEDHPGRTMEDYRINYEQTLIAALMFPNVYRYETMPWPERIFGRVSDAQATQVLSVLSVLQSMCEQKGASLQTEKLGIGAFIADSMMWQRAEPVRSSWENFDGLTYPLLAKGVPVQVLSLDRVHEPNYLNEMRVMLLNYDILTPPSPDAHEALKRWVNNGGWLIVTGDDSAFALVPDTWWQEQGYPSPLAHLFNMLWGTPLTRMQIPSSPMPSWTPLLREEQNVRDLSNRRRYRIDLSPFVRESDTVLVRFGDAQPDDGWGAWLAEVKLEINGQPAVAFRAGSEMERAYLVHDSSSGVLGGARFADGHHFWTYRLPAPRGAQVVLEVDMGNQYEVSASGQAWQEPVLVRVDPMHTRLPSRLAISSLQPLFSISPPQGAEELMRERNSGLPVVWRHSVGKGGVLVCGFAPGLFARSREGGELLRTLVSLCCAASRTPYNEPGYLLLRRGQYLITRCFERSASLAGTFVDVLKPDLPLLSNPTVPAGGWALLKEVPKGSRTPRVLHATARVVQQREDASVTALIITAPADTTASVRLYTAGRSLVKAQAWDAWGQSLPVQVQQQDASVLVTFPNRAEGVGLRVDWR